LSVFASFSRSAIDAAELVGFVEPEITSGPLLEFFDTGFMLSSPSREINCMNRFRMFGGHAIPHWS
jgi:hypothetical protein